MSNTSAELAVTARAGERADNGVQIIAGANFDALALHREGANLRAPVVVADAHVAPAVFHPGEIGGAVLENAGYRDRGRIEIGRGGLHVGIGIGDPFYYGYPGPYGYSYPLPVPEVCAPQRYLNAPPVCYPAERGGVYFDYGHRYHVPERDYRLRELPRRHFP